ncbi:MAG TPA: MarR family winged helix-turn-helix transcriptional regulator [Candidatus Corynebacterium avicola]|uniref:MarR family winged helix-turn-helix transcriptional regulator n=1 Tax=Candidatus Corynebacterium avicola TaxID=2838527 RepID=A0A9D1RPA3_9CORY|nr:MarR family winged helix-turn-helix transcriptional regulator [Candidatus Corynebacterium avicola]
MVAEAVDTLVRRNVPATVNVVAEEIGMDQSGASRLVNDAIVKGVLEPVEVPSDRRRREVTVSSEGYMLLRQARAWQESIFDELTSGWDERRRADFEAAMTDLIERSYAIDE